MSDAKPIRILSVDDHEFLAEGLKTKLSGETDLEFVGWLSRPDTLVTEVGKLNPDIVLLDIEMPGPDPFDVLEDLQRRHPEVRVIMLSAYIRDHYIDSAFQRGAWGYVSKADDPSNLVTAIRSVANGDFAFGDKVLERTQGSGGGAANPPTSRLSVLTPRELQVLRLIGKGMSRLEIAKALHRSPKTVDNHRSAIMDKLDIHDRAELVRYAISEGLTDL